MGDEESSIICIDSDSDSDATVVFVPKKRPSRRKLETGNQLSMTPQTQIDINPFFGVRQLNRLRTIILVKYNAIMSASEKIQNLLNANPKLLDGSVVSSTTNAYVNAISMRWELEIHNLQLDHERLATSVADSSSQAPGADALLAKIKRTRWCKVCFNPAQICDLSGVYFCSIDCQLEQIDA